ncbi:hypothetical protein L873DRAFT_1665440 [Choiromyces venosus 120613-1]|uniref:Uncharacterized protein n=1 Tax=Choiromyces venosus 120613-1 TaxID=1336337 RepID=A0A3N4K2T5_9PEZI|nr:hypothetical protein L873DRAFT_1665440 [Choiromyces venosus 120613-1]
MHGAALTNGVDGSGKDGTFPLFVRVNGIVWPQTVISKYIRGGDGNRENGVITGDVEEEWIIDITGLTGATEYDFEFVKKGGKIVYRTSACTMPAQASSAAPPVTKQPSRPLSPITTLLHSLSQANSCLTEKKNRLKAVKKNQKSALSDIRKETEKNRSLLGNDRGDERAFRRILALKESIKRADEETEKMTKELEGLQNLPEKLKAEWKAKKRSWREERDRLLSAQNQAGEVKEAAERQTSAVESEAASLVQKKEKLTVRLGKLRADLEKLEKEHQQNIEARQKREAERENVEKHRHSLEKEFSDAILRMEQKTVDFRMYSADNWAAFYAYESSIQSQLPSSTPDTGLPGANSNRNSLHISTPPGLMLHQGSYAASSSSLPVSSAIPTRERSSSVFSSESVVTNMSELERSEMIRATSFPRGNSLDHATSFFPGMMMGAGPALVGSSNRKEI